LVDQLTALRSAVIGLANASPTEESLFGAHQGLLLDLVDRAQSDGVDRSEIITAGTALIQTLLDVASRDQVPISQELTILAEEALANGHSLNMPSEPLTLKPLSEFPSEPSVIHTLFVDEAGTPSFEETSQPVMSLVGIIVKDDAIHKFEVETAKLLSAYGLASQTEIHAYDCISGRGPFATITDPGRRHQLLVEFATLGVSLALGVHHMGILKPLMKYEFRQKLNRLSLDPYTSAVIWFNVTLSVGVVPIIGLRKYRYVFDRTDNYRKRIRRISQALKASENPGLRVSMVEGDPIEADSADHRFIQLADVAGFFMTRQRQLETKTFRPNPNLLKYEPQVREVYEILKPKLVNFVSERRYLLIDWKALQEWSPFL